MNDRYAIYLNAFTNTLQRYAENPEKYTKQAIFYGVRVIISKPKQYNKTADDFLSDFQLIGVIEDLMSRLTPGEFMNLFPIEKDFNGHKWGMKDYFYTREYINTLEHEKPIGGKITEFLMEYSNKEIEEFIVKSILCLSRIRQLEGKPSLAEEWAADMGIKTYTMHTDSQGKQYLYDKETGKTNPLKKPKPKYLKVVK